MTVGIDEGSRLSAWLSPFRPLFTHPTWQRVLVLIEGAVLAPHRRTISAALRAAGKDEGIVTLSQYRRFWGHFGYLARALTRWIRSPEPNTLGHS